ncbi:MAG: hypothetical protein ABI373_05755, partial [Flavobacteriales bacterium]
MQIGSVLTVLMMLCAAGCKKDDPAPDPAAAGGPNTGGTIQMGLGTNMNVQNFKDTIQIPVNGQVTKDLDLDNDGTIDIKLYGYLAVSLGGGAQEYSWLQALRPEVRITTQIVTDTMFLHVDTAGTNIYQHYNCSRTDANDAIVSVTPGQEKVSVLEENEVLTDDGGFSTDSVNLRRPGFATPAATPQNGYFVYSDSNLNCYLFPED